MTRRLLYVAFFLEVGLLLIVLPWSTFWEQNYFGTVWPVLRALVSNNFARGAVSGLGVVNLIAGFAELMPIFTVRARSDAALHPGRPPAAYGTRPDTQVDP